MVCWKETGSLTLLRQQAERGVTRRISWSSEMLNNQEQFDPMRKKVKDISPIIHCTAPVCAADPSSTLSYFICPYILCDKNEKKRS